MVVTENHDAPERSELMYFMVFVVYDFFFLFPQGTEKIFEGIVIPTPTEESVFNTLGVPFRPPEERDH